MTWRPTVLIYCQHSMGMGHLVRSLALAEAVAERADVTFLSGGLIPESRTWPAGVMAVQLPPLSAAPAGGLLSPDPAYTVEQTLAARRAIILDTWRRTRPDVVVVELFPFGRRKFSGEILPLLDAARSSSDSPASVVCSLRDILVSDRHDQRAHDDRAALLANRYFDAVLVHADRRVACLDDSFRPSVPLTVPVYHTGFVIARPQPNARPSRRQIVVSAGGGIVGEPLFRAALAAHEMLLRTDVYGGACDGMMIVGGPFLPESAWRALATAADGVPRLELRRSLPDLSSTLATAHVSVSQCGYNTAIEVVQAGVPALVVPYRAPGENEQTQRARRLESLGAVRTVDPDELTPERLASALRELVWARRRAVTLDLAGASMSAGIIAELAGRGQRGCAPNVLREQLA